MFGIFKKKSELEKLQETYAKLMKDWHTLSKINRSKSDEKFAKAQIIEQKIQELQENI